MPDLQVIIATHKGYWFPPDSAYLPVFVGESGKAHPGQASDATGDNISNKNQWYCELTAIYWAWKNLPPCKYIGLAHYRRHFSRTGFAFGTAGKRSAVASGEFLQCALAGGGVILPKARNYFISTRKEQFVNSHGADGAASLTSLEETLQKLAPEYMETYHAVMGRTHGHIYNMFIMPWDTFDAYCTWLFSILFTTEEHILTKLPSLPPRMMGFMAERLLDVWLEQNKIGYTEMDYLFLEQQNWPAKIWRFLQRKFAG